MLKTSTAGILLLIVFSFSSTYSQTFDPSPLEGFWRGTWYNITFSSTDSAFLDIGVDEANNTLSMTLDLDGNVFGGSDPDPVTMTGNFDENGFSITGNSPTYGPMYFSGDAAGFINGRLPDVPNPAIDSTTMNGTYTINNIVLYYLVYFTGGGGTANGIISLEKDQTTNVRALTNNPAEFRLYQNYPNPFNPVTTINFSIPHPTLVTLEIYNTLGEKVATLLSKEINPGNHSVKWNASEFSSGVYFYKITTDNFSSTKKLLLLK